MCTLPWRPPLSLISSTFTQTHWSFSYYTVLYNTYTSIYIYSFHTIIKMFYFVQYSDKSVAKRILHCIANILREPFGVSNVWLLASTCQLWRLPINSRHCGLSRTAKANSKESTASMACIEELHHGDRIGLHHVTHCNTQCQTVEQIFGRTFIASSWKTKHA